MGGRCGPRRSAPQSSSAWCSCTVAEADLRAGSANDGGGRCCVRNRYQPDARSTRLCVIGLHRSGGVGCAVALAGTSEREALPGTDGESRFVGVPRKQALSAPRDNTWSHVLRAGASRENSSMIPIWGSGRGADVQQGVFDHHDLDQSRSVRGTALWCGPLGRAALDEPVFILRAQDILAPRVVVRWAHLAEQAGTAQDKVRGALEVAKQMADWQANNPYRVKVPD